jgi:hypothetical protein
MLDTATLSSFLFSLLLYINKCATLLFTIWKTSKQSPFHNVKKSAFVTLLSFLDKNTAVIKLAMKVEEKENDIKNDIVKDYNAIIREVLF